MQLYTLDDHFLRSINISFYYNLLSVKQFSGVVYLHIEWRVMIYEVEELSRVIQITY